MKSDIKPRDAICRLQAQAGSQRVWFLIDTGRRQIMVAPEPARRLWGLPRSLDGEPIALDASMPAVSDLARIAVSGAKADCSTVSLVFWTGRGVRQWRCRIMAQRPSAEVPSGVLVVPELQSDDPMRVHAGASAEEAGTTDGRVARIVHELRTPLAAIQAYADLLRETEPSLGARGYINTLRQAAHHALAVVADIAPRGREDAEAQGLPLELIDVDEIVRAAVEMMRPLALRTATEITVVDGVRGRTALSHRRALMQVLINLLANAVRHAGPAPNVVVKTSLTRAGEVMVEVSDTGPGIPASAVRLAAKGDTGTGGAVEGGMGLAISRQLAARAGARLEIGRAKRGGARVRLVLAGPALQAVRPVHDVAAVK